MLEPPSRWRTPDELVELGFARSRVVMINEAHDGLRRSIRTRRIGARVLPAAHAAGCRHLAMEALYVEFAREANETRRVPAAEHGYLAQPELRDLIGAALGLGWTLLPYEATGEPPDFSADWEAINWREQQQARNLVDALAQLPGGAKLLVWCGNSHHSKHHEGDWLPMGFRFRELSGIDPFAIDQTRGIRFGREFTPMNYWLAVYADEIGKAAGFLAEEAPAGWPDFGVDAYVVSGENELE
jgi:hypothetical protein